MGVAAVADREEIGGCEEDDCSERDGEEEDVEAYECGSPESFFEDVGAFLVVRGVG